MTMLEEFVDMLQTLVLILMLFLLCLSAVEIAQALRPVYDCNEKRAEAPEEAALAVAMPAEKW